VSYQDVLRGLGNQVEQVELAYQQAVKAGHGDEFAAAIESRYADDTGNLLYAAWHYRLIHAAATVKRRAIAWGWALPLAVLNGLILWLLSDDQRFTLKLTNPFTGVTTKFVSLVPVT